MKTIGKKIAIFLFSIVITFSLSGCLSIGIVHDWGVRGQGKMIEKEYSVSPYHSVVVSGHMTVVYKAGTSDTIKIEIQENLVEYLVVTVRNNCLFVETTKSFVTANKNDTVLYITAPTLEMCTFDRAKIKDWDPVHSEESFQLYGNGTIDGEMEIYADKVYFESYGHGETKLTGKTSELCIGISGSGIIDAFGLEAENVTVEIGGSGKISVSCSKKLSVTIYGSGTVNYRGDPTITKNIMGSGKINKVAE